MIVDTILTLYESGITMGTSRVPDLLVCKTTTSSLTNCFMSVVTILLTFFLVTIPLSNSRALDLMETSTSESN